MARKGKEGSTKSSATVQRLSEREDFVSSFETYAEDLTSPSIFSKWAAISAIAGALERKVWVYTAGSNLYPNMFIVLVAPAGIGKSEVTWRVSELWEGLEEHHLASSSVTKASLMDELNQAKRRYITNNPEEPVVSYNSLLICTNEMGVLLPAYENEFMHALTDLWDCKGYSESRRGRNKSRDNPDKIEPMKIPRPQLHLLAACTPDYLGDTMPEGAWGQGFISRTILIFSAERKIRSLFEKPKSDNNKWEQMQSDLQIIGELYGEIQWEQEAAELIDQFHMSGGEPQPTHPKLHSYCIRRVVHLLKLCMVSSVSRSNELIIRKEDFHRALAWLLEAEAAMPEIFKAMSSGGTSKIIQEAWHYLFEVYSREKKPIAKYRLVQFLQTKAPVHLIEMVVRSMLDGKVIEKVKAKPGQMGEAYVPKTDKFE